MNENAKVWVLALKSGEYCQTSEELQNCNGYCCLGVACTLYEQVTGDKLPLNRGGFYNEGELQGDFDCVRRWLGLRTGDGSFEYSDRRWPANSLVSLNDGYNCNFAYIANVIEAEPEGLFEDETT